jgi:hypothetical protein
MNNGQNIILSIAEKYPLLSPQNRRIWDIKYITEVMISAIYPNSLKSIW